MWTYEKRNKARETLSRIVWASATGSLLGLTVGVLETAVTGTGTIRRRTSDLMLLGGTYAITEAALEKWTARSTYTPIIAGCVAGALASRGTARSVLTTSALAATLGYAIEHREDLLRRARSAAGTEKPASLKQ